MFILIANLICLIIKYLITIIQFILMSSVVIFSIFVTFTIPIFLYKFIYACIFYVVLLYKIFIKI